MTKEKKEKEPKGTLFRAIKSTLSSDIECRCVHFINRVELKADDFVELAREIFGECLDIYFYEDDIFIVSPLVSLRKFIEFNEYIVKKFDISIDEAKEILRIYDLRSNWDSLSFVLGDKDVDKNIVHQNFMDLKSSCSIELKDRIKSHFLQTPFSKGAINIDDEAKRKIVLIVEDDEFTAKILMSIVGGENYLFVTTSGKEAIEIFKYERPDITFLDIGLPDISGHEVLEEIKEVDENANVVMVSADSTITSITESMNKNVLGFVGKPFSVDKILRYMGSV